MPSVSDDAPPLATTELRPRWRLSLGDYVAGLAVTRNARWVAAALGDGSVAGLAVDDGATLFRVAAHAGGALGVSLSPDGALLASCGQEATAKLWDAEGHLLAELPGGGLAWVEHVAWAPRGARLATAAGKTVRLWSATGELLQEHPPLASTITGLSWRSDGSGLAVSCYGGVQLLPLVPGAKARHLTWKGSLISLAWSPDDRVIACGSQDSSVHFWRVATGRDSQMSGYPSKPKALSWDHESKLLATSGDAAITVWDFRGQGPEGTTPIQLASHRGLCTRLAFHPRRGWLASGSQDTSVLLWEPRRGERPLRFAFLEEVVTELAWLDDALLGADAAGTLCAWKAA